MPFSTETSLSLSLHHQLFSHSRVLPSTHTRRPWGSKKFQRQLCFVVLHLIDPLPQHNPLSRCSSFTSFKGREILLYRASTCRNPPSMPQEDRQSYDGSNSFSCSHITSHHHHCLFHRPVEEKRSFCFMHTHMHRHFAQERSRKRCLHTSSLCRHKLNLMSSFRSKSSSRAETLPNNNSP